MNSGTANNGRNGNGRTIDPWDELLSAYVDGEVSEAERVLVEQRLETDPAARESLRELKEISNLLRTLPRDPAPPELRPATLKLAEQRSLLGTVATAASLPWRLRRREWMAGLTGLVATLAAVTIIPSFYVRQAFPEVERLRAGRSQDDFGVARETGAVRDGATVPVAMLDGTEDAKLGVNQRLRSFAGASSPESRGSEGLGADAPLRASDFSRREKERAEAAGIANATLSAAMVAENAADKATVDADGDSGLKRLEAWQDVQPYLNLLSQNTGAVANVDLMVADVDQATDEFEVLLMQNGVLMSAPAHVSVGSKLGEDTSGKPEAAGSVAAAAAKPTEGARVAMYVEANGEPITKALEEMVRRRRLVSLKLQPPLQVQSEETEEVIHGPGGEFSKNRYIVSDLRDAYWIARFGTDGAKAIEDAPVSAAVGVSNTQLAQNLEKLPNLKLADSQGASPLNYRLSMAHGADRKAGAKDAELANNYSQRVTLEPPQTNWYLELQQQQSQLTRNTLEDLAFEAEMKQAGNNSLRKLQRDFLATAPNTVRVLFVMQPTPAGSSPDAPVGVASEPVSKTPTVPAAPIPRASRQR